MNRVALVRSVSHDQSSHDRACRDILTIGASERVPPSIGTYLAYHANERPAPAYVALPGRNSACGYLGSGSLPARYGPLTRAATSDYGLGIEMFSNAFELEREPVRIREEYGLHGFGRDCLTARRLIEAGSRFIVVSLGGWDHHAEIGSACRRMVPMLDQGMSVLIADLERRGLLNETLVVWMGEFGRTPQINALGGRDHLPRAGCALFAGAGVPGGWVIGETDKIGGEPIDRPISPGCIAATIFAKLGVRPSADFDSGKMSKNVLVSEPIRELI
jgi:hypothetical protein